MANEQGAVSIGEQSYAPPPLPRDFPKVKRFRRVPPGRLPHVEVLTDFPPFPFIDDDPIMKHYEKDIRLGRALSDDKTLPIEEKRRLYIDGASVIPSLLANIRRLDEEISKPVSVDDYPGMKRDLIIARRKMASSKRELRSLQTEFREKGLPVKGEDIDTERRRPVLTPDQVELANQFNGLVDGYMEAYNAYQPNPDKLKSYKERILQLALQDPIIVEYGESRKDPDQHLPIDFFDNI
jgi:hypothetical protein